MPELKEAPEDGIRSGEIPLQNCRAVEISDADMRVINSFAHTPLTRDQVSIITMELINDKVDNHFSRFPEVEIRRVTRLIVGKPLTEFHDMQTRQPRGTIFRASYVRDERGARAIGEAYILKIPENEEFLANIAAGIYRGTSMQWVFKRAECSICNRNLRECIHTPGMSYDGVECHYIMHNVVRVYEQSVVPLGSQSTEIIGIRATEGTQDNFLDSLYRSGKPRAEGETVVASAAQDVAPETPEEPVKPGAKRVLAEIAKDQARAHELSRTLQPELSQPA